MESREVYYSKQAMDDSEELYYFCSIKTYPTGFSKNQKRALKRKCQEKFKVERRYLYYNKVDWRQVPRDRGHVERSCRSSLQGKLYSVNTSN